MDRAEHDERRRVVTREGAFPGAEFDLQDLAGDRCAHRPALDLALYGADLGVGDRHRPPPLLPGDAPPWSRRHAGDDSAPRR